MDRPVTFTSSGAQHFAQSVWNLYTELARKFGDPYAREFILNFYKGAGKP